jgi:Fe-S cluster assembly iron-binding protein IscA
MTKPMQIDISDKAQVYLSKKVHFFRSKNRVPRIVITERSCSGAVFRIFFEPAQEDDLIFEQDGLQLYVPKNTMEEFSGFHLDLEQFFFTSRLLIKPVQQSYACNCSAKCAHAATLADEIKEV